MTDLILLHEKLGELTVSWNDFIQSDRSWNRQGRKVWEISFNEGVLTDLEHNRELFAFHFVDSKVKDDFQIEKSGQPQKKVFTLTEKGIHS